MLALTNGTVVKMDDFGEVIKNGFVVIDGYTIRDVGMMAHFHPDLAGKDGEIIDVRGNIITPGLVDSHTHIMQQLLRGGWPKKVKYPGWKYVLIPWEANLTPEDIHLSVKMAAVNALRNGVTTLSEHGARPDYIEYIANELKATGIRATLAMCAIDQDVTPPPVADHMKMTTRELLDAEERLVAQYPFRKGGLIRGTLSLRQLLTCSPELIIESTDMARKYDTMVQFHLAEGHYENLFTQEHYNARPTEYMESIGALGPHLIAAHCVLLTAEEVSKLAWYDVGIPTCPHGTLGHLGLLRIREMMMSKCSLGLGSDGGSGGTTDILRAGYALQRAAAMEVVSYGERNLLSDEMIFCMATIGGANAIGLREEIGSIEIGKLADIVVWEPSANAYPWEDPYRVLVHGAANVDMVLVNGTIVIENGINLRVDEARLCQVVQSRGLVKQQPMRKQEAARTGPLGTNL